MAKRKEIEPCNVFTCSCGNATGLCFEDFKKHLSEYHELSASEMKGKRVVLCHIDADTWFSWDYAWTLDSGLCFTQFVKQHRERDDAMRYKG